MAKFDRQNLPESLNLTDERKKSLSELRGNAKKYPRRGYPGGAFVYLYFPEAFRITRRGNSKINRYILYHPFNFQSRNIYSGGL